MIYTPSHPLTIYPRTKEEEKMKNPKNTKHPPQYTNQQQPPEKPRTNKQRKTTKPRTRTKPTQTTTTNKKPTKSNKNQKKKTKLFIFYSNIVT
jgi:hypothetical protein